jgi:hypothetical protein
MSATACLEYVVVKIVSLECVMIKIISFSMNGMRCGQNYHFQHAWNVLWSKLSVSASLDCVMVKIVSFSMPGMCLRIRMLQTRLHHKKTDFRC